MAQGPLLGAYGFGLRVQSEASEDLSVHLRFRVHRPGGGFLHVYRFLFLSRACAVLRVWLCGMSRRVRRLDALVSPQLDRWKLALPLMGSLASRVLACRVSLMFLSLLSCYKKREPM